VLDVPPERLETSIGVVYVPAIKRSVSPGTMQPTALASVCLGIELLVVAAQELESLPLGETYRVVASAEVTLRSRTISGKRLFIGLSQM
jgi:hypothetical protein